MTPAPGSAVRVVMSKWGDRPHWEFGGVLLGSDAQGDWVGIAGGSHFSRPGAEYVAPVDQVMLAPAGHHWMATFHADGGPVEVYVDMTTPPVWDGNVLRAVDLDLDVVRGATGRVWVDDEDEFADHRTRFGYPDEVVRAALDSCDRVRDALEHAVAPYDGRTHRAWLRQLRALVGQ
ncbi:DUF402 domain-containing protein [Nocardioides sp. GCM10027113]|uniref:DUF402 domain-containing protein n=1 Tax=unclassified Nocardioides TaxID=2615069 RepID=UPI00361DCC85